MFLAAFGGKNHGLIRGIMLLLVVTACMSVASAFEPTDLQWTQGVSGKLIRDETLTYMGYSVKAVAFPSPVASDRYREIPEEPVNPFVGLQLSKNGIVIDTIVLGTAESYIFPDSQMKVTVKELPSRLAREWLFENYAPFAIVQLDSRGTPRLEVSMETDEDEYLSSSDDIVVMVELTNMGSADAVNVKMEIETELSLKRGQVKYNYDRVEKGDSITETITFASPTLSKDKTFRIFAKVSGYDVMELAYSATFLQNILITARPQQGLTIKKFSIEKMYLKDYALVSLTIKNHGNDEVKGVIITDFLPEGMKLLGNGSLHWVVDIPANGEWDNRYLIKPTEENSEGVVLPAATAEYKIGNEPYMIRSNEVEIVVYGPRVTLMKETDVDEVEQGDAVQVTVTAENSGSTPTRVIINDSLPDGVSIIEGRTDHEAFLEAERKVNFTYTLIINSEPPVLLPPAKAAYFELGTQGEKIITQSEEIELAPPADEIQDQPPNVTLDEYEADFEEQPDEPEIEEEVPELPSTTSIGDFRSILLNYLTGCNGFYLLNPACSFLNQSRSVDTELPFPEE